MSVVANGRLATSRLFFLILIFVLMGATLLTIYVIIVVLWLIMIITINMCGGDEKKDKQASAMRCRDVELSLSNAKGYCERFIQLCNQDPPATHQEKEWLSTELRNTLRSIEWDLEDLEETTAIVEKGTGKYYTKLNNDDIIHRRQFIQRTKATIEELRDKMSGLDARFKSSSSFATSIRESMPTAHSQYKYSRLENDGDLSDSGGGSKFVNDTLEKQQLIIRSQDENLEKIGGSVHILKDMSGRIGNELDEQAIMLDDLGNEMESSHSRLDMVMKKLAKVTHMSDDKRQWQAIAVLVVVLIIVIILFIVL